VMDAGVWMRGGVQVKEKKVLTATQDFKAIVAE
jgi:hypothetical protein